MSLTSFPAARLIAPVALLLIATACDESPSGPTAGLDTAFTLAPRQTTAIAGTDMTVRFDGVAGDSRCPADAICILGGDAQVQITVEGIGARRHHDLHTGTMAPVRHDDFTIALIELAPYPFSSRTIAPGEYRATLRVTR